MGSTGRGFSHQRGPGDLSSDTFGIPNAVVFKGMPPEGSGIEKPAANKVTLKVPAIDDTNVLFQFKLSKDNKEMTIIGYKNGVPEVKCKVAVDAGQPSLDKVIAEGSKAEKVNATKMKDLFAKSEKIKENQLGSIAQELLRKKQERGNK